MFKRILTLFGGSHKSNGRKLPRQNGASARRHSRFECLEDRSMLATLTVSVSADGAIANNDGNLTLREAIAYVNLADTPGPADLVHIQGSIGQNDRIVFESALSGETIALLFGELSISRSVTIDASMLSQGLTIDANDPTPAQKNGDGGRIFNISGGPGAEVELVGLTLTGGDTPVPTLPFLDVEGGAIRTSGASLTIRDCTITGNSSTHEGGGVWFNAENCELKVLSTIISGNQSTNVDGNRAFGHGGGMFVKANSGSIEIRDSTIDSSKICAIFALAV